MKTNFSPDNLESDLCWHTFSLPSSCQGETLFCRLAEPDNALPRRCPDLARHVRSTSTATFRSFAFLPEKDLSSADTTTWDTAKAARTLPVWDSSPPKTVITIWWRTCTPSPLHLKKRYPDLPLFLFGHSMGSMIARLYLSKYASPLAGRGAVRHRRTQSRLARRYGAVPAHHRHQGRDCTAPLAFIR